MRVGEGVLSHIVQYLEIETRVIVVQGESIEITPQDIYFLTRLPMIGIFNDTQPLLPCGRRSKEMIKIHGNENAKDTYNAILITNLECLETLVVVVVVVHIMGTCGPHRIPGGLTMLIESVLDRTYYGWAHMLLMALK
jgi:hypothetical protein